ncbi:hypothetical protein ACLOJK_018700 [Asimina triloba]
MPAELQRRATVASTITMHKHLKIRCRFVSGQQQRRVATTTISPSSPTPVDPILPNPSPPIASGVGNYIAAMTDPIGSVFSAHHQHAQNVHDSLANPSSKLMAAFI